MDIIGELRAALLDPLEEAINLVSAAIDKLGEGVEWTGDALQAFAGLVAELAAKVEELQSHANDAA